MSVVDLFALFWYSLLGALIPVFNVEAAVVVAVERAGGTTPALLMASMSAALGTMIGKLQVYLIARGGRAYGAKWMQRRAERDAAKAATKAEERATKAELREARLAENPPGPLGRGLRRLGNLFIGRNTEKAGVLVTFVSAFSGLPPFAVVSAVAGASRMRWDLFFVTGVAGRFLRFTVGTVIIEAIIDAWRATT